MELLTSEENESMRLEPPLEQKRAPEAQHRECRDRQICGMVCCILFPAQGWSAKTQLDESLLSCPDMLGKEMENAESMLYFQSESLPRIKYHWDRN